MTTWLRRAAIAGAVVFLLAAPVAAQPAFTEVSPLNDSLWVTDENTDFWINSVAPADVDGDGDLDLAVIGFYVVYFESAVHRLVLFLNQGLGTDGRWVFTQREVALGDITAGASNLVWADFDNDGDPDLTVGSDGTTVIYRNDAGVLSKLPNALPPYFEASDYEAAYDLRSLSWADADNDGDLDLLVPSVLDPDTFLFRTSLVRNDGPDGAGGWRFTETLVGLDPTGHAQSSWADDDKDGDLDLLIVNVDPSFTGSFIRRYENLGGVFVGQDVLGIQVTRGFADWGDFDGDGDMDIVVAGIIDEGDEILTHELRVYRNEGGGRYVPTTLPVPTDNWLDFHGGSWADYNSDGVVDLLLTGSFIGEQEIEGRSEIYLNSGGTFTPSGANLSAPIESIGRGGTFSWLDIDGDGDLDYLVAGAYFVPGGNGLVEAQIHLSRNDAVAVNRQPSAPAALAAIDLGLGTVLLSWAPAVDDSTSRRALTYELEIKPANAAASDTAVAPSLRRRLPQPGNVSAVTRWKLRNLPAGTYDWTVRAVDSAFNGGSFTSGTFTVTRPPQPIAAIVRPTGGGTVRGRVAIQIWASDNQDAARQLQIFVQPAAGQLLRTIYNPVTQLHTAFWNTTAVPDGSYSVGAFVLDSDGNWGASRRVPVTVNNVP